MGSLILGAGTLQEFALALFVGQLSGAYSSIFIASPILALLKEREPKFAATRARLGGSTASGAAEQDALAGRTTARRAAAAGEAPAPTGRRTATAVAERPVVPVELEPEPEEPFVAAEPEVVRTPAAARPRPSTGGITPRPRKKGKRR